MQETGSFPFQYAITAAKAKTKERYPGFRILNMMPEAILPGKLNYTFCYAYFRCLDNLVDTVTQELGDPQPILERQERILAGLYKGPIKEELFTEELFLAHLVQYDLRNDQQLKPSLERLLGTFLFDNARRHKIITREQLSKYVDDNVVPYIDITTKLFGVAQQTDALYQLARAGFAIDFIRDLATDIRTGYINIPVEDIEAYTIDLGNPKTLQLWKKDQLSQLKRSIDSIEAINKLNWRLRLIAKAMVNHRKKTLAALAA